ncbi:MAG TPA: P-II family nitrogen regulator [Candidatus Margulisiibacteriota bacterium]|nr:P-II family nitrogen regulator [Candidatus Margulisiibacteriota bacterium]
MKKVETLIAAHQLDAVVDALRARGVEEVVVSEVLESSPSRARLYRGVKYAVDFAAEIKLETVVDDELAMPTVHCITEARRGTPAATARIFITPVEAVIEIGGRDSVPAAAWRAQSAWAADISEVRGGV